MGLKTRFLTSLQHLNINPGKVCLVGISGGGDSIALLALMAEVAPTMLFDVRAVRVSHGLRNNDEELAESELCTKLCHRLNVTYSNIYLHSGEVQILQQELGCGTEQAARQARLTCIENHRRKIGADIIFLGHTADDQLETILTRLLTASGPEGLKGIPHIHNKIYRPLLTERRETLRQWLRKRHILWAEDSSNNSALYRRNRIRNELIPLLSDIIPGWEMATLILSKRSIEVRESLRVLQEHSVKMEWTKKGVCWLVSDWIRAPAYIKAMILWDVWDKLDSSGIPDRRFSWASVSDARQILDTAEHWEGFGIAIHKKGEYFHAFRKELIAGKARIILHKSDISNGRWEALIAPWRVCITSVPMAGGHSYPIQVDDWPLRLSITNNPQNYSISLYGRNKKIIETSASSIFGNVEIIYIVINEYKDS